jgi:DNA-directed RNA polymerase subunit N (RpoN/RPB10)
MIIPMVCFTCGKPISHLWEPYIKEVTEHYNKAGIDMSKNIHVEKTLNELEKPLDNIEKKTLDNMGLTRYCCRRMIVSHVDLTKKI